MTDPLVEAVARAIYEADESNLTSHRTLASAALAIARPAIRREALEEAKAAAENAWSIPNTMYYSADLEACAKAACLDAAAAITALMEKTDDPK